MTRVPAINPGKLDPEQRKVHDAIAGTRGGVVRGPFAIWIRTPNLAAAANQLGNAIRLDGKLDRELFEMIILVVARQWSAQYEWFAHSELATAAGLDPALIEAIRTRRQPQFSSEREQTVYEMVCELTETKDLSDSTYARALGMFGIDLVSEIVTVIGFYTLVAMMLKAFDAPVPGNARPLD